MSSAFSAVKLIIMTALRLFHHKNHKRKNNAEDPNEKTLGTLWQFCKVECAPPFWKAAERSWLFFRRLFKQIEESINGTSELPIPTLSRTEEPRYWVCMNSCSLGNVFQLHDIHSLFNTTYNRSLRFTKSTSQRREMQCILNYHWRTLVEYA